MSPILPSTIKPQTISATLLPPTLFDIPFDPVTQKEVLETVSNRVDQGKTTRIVTINSEFILSAQKNTEFKQVLQTADLHLADGIGIIWATNFLQNASKMKEVKSKKKSGLIILLSTSYFLLFFQFISSLLLLPFFPKRYHNPLPERVTGSDLFEPLIKLLIEKKQTVFLLGGAPGVAETVARKFRTQSSKFRVITHPGSPHESEAQKIVKLINDSQASALFVAFQFPEQDIWIARHLAEMPHIKIAMGVGGTFDFIAGTAHIAHGKFKARRAPKLIQKLNLEWLWRLITQPFRWKRIFNATIVFSWKVYQEAKRMMKVKSKV